MAGLENITLANYTTLKYNLTVAGTGTQTFDKEVSNLSSVGEISDEATIVDIQEYGTKYLRKLVGSANAGTLEVVVNFDPTDTSFVDLEKAYTDETRIAFQIIMTTAVDTTSAAGSAVEFIGIVASKTMSNEFDATRQVTFSIAIDGAISKVYDTGSAPSDDPE